jgi:hypothetical protein
MSELTTQQFTVKLDDITHLFVAPEFDPFSDQEAELLGQPALNYVLRQLGPARVKEGGPIHLIVQLPPEKVTPDLKARTTRALQRFCAVRIADDETQSRMLRWNSWRSLPSAIAALAACLILSYLFLSQTFTFLSPAINGLLVQGFGIISWVVLWHPVEEFLYDPIPLQREIAALHRDTGNRHRTAAQLDTKHTAGQIHRSAF